MSIRRLRKAMLQGGFLFMVLVGALGQTGCKSSRETLEEKILTTLEVKYEDSFVVDAMGGNWAGGFPNNNTMQALCYPKSDSSLRFVVEINKETHEVYDRYLNELVGRNEEANIQELASKVWEESTVIVTNDTVMTYPRENDKAMRNSEFLKIYPQNTQIIDVFVSGKESVDAEEEIKKIEDLTKELAKSDYLSTLISIIYVAPESYKQIPQIREEHYSVDSYLSEEEKVYCRMGSSIDKKGLTTFNEGQYKKNLSKYRKWEAW